MRKRILDDLATVAGAALDRLPRRKRSLAKLLLGADGGHALELRARFAPKRALELVAVDLAGKTITLATLEERPHE